MDTSLLEKLGSKAISKTELLNMAEEDSELVPLLLEGTKSPKAAIRYGCASVLMDLSAKHTSDIYPYMDRFTSLLDSKYRILTWNALATLANLTAADTDRKFDAIFNRYYGFLGSEYMVTVANVVANSTTIAQNKPYLAERIAAELLKVESIKVTPHLTEECKRVIAEKTIQTFGVLMRYIPNGSALVAFAEKHKNSSRASLRRQVQVFLDKWAVGKV